MEAFKDILTSGLKSENIMTDQRIEFLNKLFRAFMKKEDIELYNTCNETKAPIIERACLEKCLENDFYKGCLGTEIF